MYKRSDFRHACYRAKKNAAEDKHKVLLDIVEPLLSIGQTWANFSTKWDLLLNKEGKVKIIKPESNYDFIHSTLLEASVYAKQGIDFDSFDDRQLNIIVQVEAILLEPIMDFKNYNKVWGVELEPTTKQIKTKLYQALIQKEVTEDMIKASMKDADGNPLTPTEVTQLEAKPMTEQQVKDFEDFLKRKYPNKG